MRESLAVILRKQLSSSDMSEDLRYAWLIWSRRHGIDPNEVVGDQVIEVDTEAKTITYIGFDLCEKGHRHCDWETGGTKARQSVRVVKLETTPAVFPEDHDDTCERWHSLDQPWDARVVLAS